MPPIAPVVHTRPPVPLPTPAKQMAVNTPVMVGNNGLTILADKMLSSHTCGRATDWELWGNSFSNQFHCVVNTMTQSLRIKENT